MEKYGLLEWPSSSQLISISTNDEASMIGAQKGLMEEIRQNLSHVIGVHHVAHGLNLSVLNSVKKIKTVLMTLTQFSRSSTYFISII